jgi:hypothetical protein
VTRERDYRYWEGWEKDLLRRHYGERAADPRPGAELAARLNRSVRSVREAAERLGLTVPKCRLDYKEARRLYRQGLSDYGIGAALGRSHNTVRSWRKKLRLPANGGRR